MNDRQKDFNYDRGEFDVKDQFDTFMNAVIPSNQMWQSEADIDERFYVGDQGLWNDLYAGIAVSVNKRFYFNKIMRIINMVSGYQRRNRKTITVVPQENGDAQTADQLTKVLLYIINKDNVLETISEAFKGGLVTGMNLLQIWVDYRKDPVNGDIRVDNCPYNCFMIDPYFKKADLSDCSGIVKRTYLSREDAISLLPDKSEEILNLPALNSSAPPDGRFMYMPEQFNANYQNLLAYDEYYFRDYRLQTLIVDTETGESHEWRSNDKFGLEEFLKEYPQLTKIETTVPTVRLAIFVQDKLMYYGPNPIGIDSFPFVPVIAYYNPHIPYYSNRLMGICRNLRDSQFLFNRRKISELDLCEATQTGLMFKEESLIDPSSVYMTGNGRGIALKREANMTDVQLIPSNSPSQAWIELSDRLDKDMMDISGANESTLGSATDDKAGILEMLRQGSGLTTLQILFDNLDRAQRIFGTRLLEMIPLLYTIGKIRKILEGQEPTPEFYNKAFGQYNCVVEDGILTQTQRQMQFAQMLQLREMGVPIPSDELLEAATIQNKSRIIESIRKQQEEAKQQQQLQMQMEVAKAQSDIKDSNARSLANIGLYNERTSRVTDNRSMAVERLHEANRHDEQALLDRIKALKEIESMDTEHIARLLEISNVLRQDENQRAEQGLETIGGIAPDQESKVNQGNSDSSSMNTGNSPLDQIGVNNEDQLQEGV